MSSGVRKRQFIVAILKKRQAVTLQVVLRVRRGVIKMRTESKTCHAPTLVAEKVPNIYTKQGIKTQVALIGSFKHNDEIKLGKYGCSFGIKKHVGLNDTSKEFDYVLASWISKRLFNRSMCHETDRCLVQFGKRCNALGGCLNVGNKCTVKGGCIPVNGRHCGKHVLRTCFIQYGKTCNTMGGCLQPNEKCNTKEGCMPRIGRTCSSVCLEIKRCHNLNQCVIKHGQMCNLKGGCLTSNKACTKRIGCLPSSGRNLKLCNRAVFGKCVINYGEACNAKGGCLSQGAKRQNKQGCLPEIGSICSEKCLGRSIPLRAKRRFTKTQAFLLDKFCTYFYRMDDMIVTIITSKNFKIHHYVIKYTSAGVQKTRYVVGKGVTKGIRVVSLKLSSIKGAKHTLKLSRYDREDDNTSVIIIRITVKGTAAISSRSLKLTRLKVTNLSIRSSAFAIGTKISGTNNKMKKHYKGMVITSRYLVQNDKITKMVRQAIRTERSIETGPSVKLRSTQIGRDTKTVLLRFVALAAKKDMIHGLVVKEKTILLGEPHPDKVFKSIKFSRLSLLKRNRYLFSSNKYKTLSVVNFKRGVAVIYKLSQRVTLISIKVKALADITSGPTYQIQSGASINSETAMRFRVDGRPTHITSYARVLCNIGLTGMKAVYFKNDKVFTFEHGRRTPVKVIDHKTKGSKQEILKISCLFYNLGVQQAILHLSFARIMPLGDRVVRRYIFTTTKHVSFVEDGARVILKSPSLIYSKSTKTGKHTRKLFTNYSVKKSKSMVYRTYKAAKSEQKHVILRIIRPFVKQPSVEMDVLVVEQKMSDTSTKVSKRQTFATMRATTVMSRVVLTKNQSKAMTLGDSARTAHEFNFQLSSSLMKVTNVFKQVHLTVSALDQKHKTLQTRKARAEKLRTGKNIDQNPQTLAKIEKASIGRFASSLVNSQKKLVSLSVNKVRTRAKLTPKVKRAINGLQVTRCITISRISLIFGTQRKSTSPTRQTKEITRVKKLGANFIPLATRHLCKSGINFNTVKTDKKGRKYLYHFCIHLSYLKVCNAQTSFTDRMVHQIRSVRKYLYSVIVSHAGMKTGHARKSIKKMKPIYALKVSAGHKIKHVVHTSVTISKHHYQRSYEQQKLDAVSRINKRLMPSIKKPSTSFSKMVVKTRIKDTTTKARKHQKASVSKTLFIKRKAKLVKPTTVSFRQTDRSFFIHRITYHAKNKLITKLTLIKALFSVEAKPSMSSKISVAVRYSIRTVRFRPSAIQHTETMIMLHSKHTDKLLFSVYGEGLHLANGYKRKRGARRSIRALRSTISRHQIRQTGTVCSRIRKKALFAFHPAFKVNTRIKLLKVSQSQLKINGSPASYFDLDSKISVTNLKVSKFVSGIIISIRTRNVFIKVLKITRSSLTPRHKRRKQHGLKVIQHYLQGMSRLGYTKLIVGPFDDRVIKKMRVVNLQFNTVLVTTLTFPVKTKIKDSTVKAKRYLNSFSKTSQFLIQTVGVSKNVIRFKLGQQVKLPHKVKLNGTVIMIQTFKLHQNRKISRFSIDLSNKKLVIIRFSVTRPKAAIINMFIGVTYTDMITTKLGRFARASNTYKQLTSADGKPTPLVQSTLQMQKSSVSESHLLKRSVSVSMIPRNVQGGVKLLNGSKMDTKTLIQVKRFFRKAKKICNTGITGIKPVHFRNNKVFTIEQGRRVPVELEHIKLSQNGQQVMTIACLFYKFGSRERTLHQSFARLMDGNRKITRQYISSVSKSMELLRMRHTLAAKKIGLCLTSSRYKTGHKPKFSGSIATGVYNQEYFKLKSKSKPDQAASLNKLVRQYAQQPKAKMVAFVVSTKIADTTVKVRKHTKTSSKSVNQIRARHRSSRKMLKLTFKSTVVSGHKVKYPHPIRKSAVQTKLRKIERGFSAADVKGVFLKRTRISLQSIPTKQVTRKIYDLIHLRQTKLYRKGIVSAVRKRQFIVANLNNKQKVSLQLILKVKRGAITLTTESTTRHALTFVAKKVPYIYSKQKMTASVASLGSLKHNREVKLGKYTCSLGIEKHVEYSKFYHNKQEAEFILEPWISDNLTRRSMCHEIDSCIIKHGQRCNPSAGCLEPGKKCTNKSGCLPSMGKVCGKYFSQTCIIRHGKACNGIGGCLRPNNKCDLENGCLPEIGNTCTSVCFEIERCHNLDHCVIPHGQRCNHFGGCLKSGKICSKMVGCVPTIGKQVDTCTTGAFRGCLVAYSNTCNKMGGCLKGKDKCSNKLGCLPVTGGTCRANCSEKYFLAFHNFSYVTLMKDLNFHISKKKTQRRRFSNSEMFFLDKLCTYFYRMDDMVVWIGSGRKFKLQFTVKKYVSSHIWTRLFTARQKDELQRVDFLSFKLLSTKTSKHTIKSIIKHKLIPIMNIRQEYRAVQGPIKLSSKKMKVVRTSVTRIKTSFNMMVIKTKIADTKYKTKKYQKGSTITVVYIMKSKYVLIKPKSVSLSLREKLGSQHKIVYKAPVVQTSTTRHDMQKFTLSVKGDNKVSKAIRTKPLVSLLSLKPTTFSILKSHSISLKVTKRFKSLQKIELRWLGPLIKVNVIRRLTLRSFKVFKTSITMKELTSVQSAMRHLYLVTISLKVKERSSRLLKRRTQMQIKQMNSKYFSGFSLVSKMLLSKRKVNKYYFSVIFTFRTAQKILTKLTKQCFEDFAVKIKMTKKHKVLFLHKLIKNYSSKQSSKFGIPNESDVVTKPVKITRTYMQNLSTKVITFTVGTKASDTTVKVRKHKKIAGYKAAYITSKHTAQKEHLKLKLFFKILNGNKIKYNGVSNRITSMTFIKTYRLDLNFKIDMSTQVLRVTSVIVQKENAKLVNQEKILSFFKLKLDKHTRVLISWVRYKILIRGTIKTRQVSFAKIVLLKSRLSQTSLKEFGSVKTAVFNSAMGYLSVSVHPDFVIKLYQGRIIHLNTLSRHSALLKYSGMLSFSPARVRKFVSTVQTSSYYAKFKVDLRKINHLTLSGNILKVRKHSTKYSRTVWVVFSTQQLLRIHSKQKLDLKLRSIQVSKFYITGPKVAMVVMFVEQKLNAAKYSVKKYIKSVALSAMYIRQEAQSKKPARMDFKERAEFSSAPGFKFKRSHKLVSVLTTQRTDALLVAKHDQKHHLTRVHKNLIQRLRTKPLQLYTAIRVSALDKRSSGRTASSTMTTVTFIKPSGRHRVVTQQRITLLGSVTSYHTMKLVVSRLSKSDKAEMVKHVGKSFISDLKIVIIPNVKAILDSSVKAPFKVSTLSRISVSRKKHYRFVTTVLNGLRGLGNKARLRVIKKIQFIGQVKHSKGHSLKYSKASSSIVNLLDTTSARKKTNPTAAISYQIGTRFFVTRQKTTFFAMVVEQVAKDTTQKVRRHLKSSAKRRVFTNVTVKLSYTKIELKEGKRILAQHELKVSGSRTLYYSKVSSYTTRHFDKVKCELKVSGIKAEKITIHRFDLLRSSRFSGTTAIVVGLTKPLRFTFKFREYMQFEESNQLQLSFSPNRNLETASLVGNYHILIYHGSTQTNFKYIHRFSSGPRVETDMKGKTLTQAKTRLKASIRGVVVINISSNTLISIRNHYNIVITILTKPKGLDNKVTLVHFKLAKLVVKSKQNKKHLLRHFVRQRLNSRGITNSLSRHTKAPLEVSKSSVKVTRGKISYKKTRFFVMVITPTAIDNTQKVRRHLKSSAKSSLYTDLKVRLSYTEIKLRQKKQITTEHKLIMSRSRIVFVSKTSSYTTLYFNKEKSRLSLSISKVHSTALDRFRYQKVPRLACFTSIIVRLKTPMRFTFKFREYMQVQKFNEMKLQYSPNRILEQAALFGTKHILIYHGSTKPILRKYQWSVLRQRIASDATSKLETNKMTLKCRIGTRHLINHGIYELCLHFLRLQKLILKTSHTRGTLVTRGYPSVEYKIVQHVNSKGKNAAVRKPYLLGKSSQVPKTKVRYFKADKIEMGTTPFTLLRTRPVSDRISMVVKLKRSSLQKPATRMEVLVVKQQVSDDTFKVKKYHIISILNMSYSPTKAITRQADEFKLSHSTFQKKITIKVNFRSFIRRISAHTFFKSKLEGKGMSSTETEIRSTASIRSGELECQRIFSFTLLNFVFLDITAIFSTRGSQRFISSGVQLGDNATPASNLKLSSRPGKFITKLTTSNSNCCRVFGRVRSSSNVVYTIHHTKSQREKVTVSKVKHKYMLVVKQEVLAPEPDNTFSYNAVTVPNKQKRSKKVLLSTFVEFMALRCRWFKEKSHLATVVKNSSKKDVNLYLSSVTGFNTPSNPCTKDKVVKVGISLRKGMNYGALFKSVKTSVLNSRAFTRFHLTPRNIGSLRLGTLSSNMISSKLSEDDVGYELFIESGDYLRLNGAPECPKIFSFVFLNFVFLDISATSFIGDGSYHTKRFVYSGVISCGNARPDHSVEKLRKRVVAKSESNTSRQTHSMMTIKRRRSP